MNKLFIRFKIRLFIYSLIIGAIYLGATFLLPENYLSPAVPWLILFFYAFTALIHYILLKASEKEPRKFFNYFMMATMLKFFVYIILIFFYVFLNRADLIPFVISFFILYIFFTGFEVVSIVRHQK